VHEDRPVDHRRGRQSGIGRHARRPAENLDLHLQRARQGAYGRRPRIDVADVTTTTYYADDDPNPGKRGNVATIRNALNHPTSITDYNAHGQPLTIVDPNGLTTTLVYDERQRLRSRTAAESSPPTTTTMWGSSSR